jgi:hypothetical protein
MATLYIAQKKPRKYLWLPMSGSRDNPMTLVPLEGLERSEVDHLVRGQLDKRGLSQKEVETHVEAAEEDYEKRAKVLEASKETKRLLEERAKGNKLMQVGHKKWKVAFYRPIKGRN